MTVKEVALNYPHEGQLYRIAGTTPHECRGAHSWPTFVRLGAEEWNESSWPQG